MCKPVGGCQNLGRIAANYPYEAEHLITHPVFANVLSNCCNGAGNLDSGCIRQWQRDELLHGPGDDLPVDRIDSAAGYVDQNLIIAGQQI